MMSAYDAQVRVISRAIAKVWGYYDEWNTLSDKTRQAFEDAAKAALKILEGYNV